LIGNGLVALTEHLDQHRRLLGDPNLIKSAIEEFLRFESPNQLGNRITAQPVEVAGVAMPVGTQITYASGQRIAIPMPSSSRTDWISGARPTGIWRSAAGSISVPAWVSRGSRRRLRSVASSKDSLTIR
jgi:hypothetical protein